ncbi:M3 family oligoendopeptidase [Rhodoblastus acidophilus]|uniref:M3 family oligoendopeptidase n=1 Tax=Candidatus Rhodoblastus alkanivorans TaxID=2954117 RepID=A0ABS9Z4D1_9HYPH|nr:M3 family oligoendopeptidase [Candidatus Rhodoblastus alkanivorans]MCI4680771.1 M3 family oligoendopeptidase [Candidatus Rhodoblastus alkanivorans]MCI4682481.1 M3 family oligoendopeptidase [Candidatus Rhodoblastus alkanivorans]MDI4639787.1 M3 family oligoendopeptidase [Rhodoblastus acidophilus]
MIHRQLVPPRNAQGAGAAPAEDLPCWRLDDLYDGLDSPRFAEDLKTLGRDCREFAAVYRGALAGLLAAPDAPKRLRDAIARYEAIDDLATRIMSFAGLSYAENTIDPARAKFYGDAQEKVTAASIDLLFFQLELNRLDDAALALAMEKPPLDYYRPWIEDLRKEKPYQLDDRLEQLFHEKSVTGHVAWNRLFDETIASLRFEIDGQEMTLEPALNLFQDPDEKVREKASDAIAATLKANLRVFALISNVLAKDKEISDTWRGFKDVAAARHLSNRVEPEVVDAMVAAVRAAYPRLSHRYYRLKARWFGKEKLRHWDRNAPLPDAPRTVYDWAQARAAVLDAYRAFAPKMAEIAEKFFDGQWIDAPVRPGKAPGAFSHPTSPSVHPYVLLNYQGKPRDVMTLAHELGHGVHQVLAAPNGPLMASTPLTLAETASVFGEMLTFRALLAEAKEPRERRALLASKVEDMLNTVVRQIAFYTFERSLHEERRHGELTAERVCELWMAAQSESLGPAIELMPGYETFWAYIPHFIHSPFYVYAYAFGDCLVNSLYGVYQKAEPGFVEKYFALLSAGGSKHYSELLAPFGLDARDPAFWNIGLSMIEGLIDELESLPA